MAFVVEDGTGLASATAYVTLSFADSYFEDRAVAAWAGTDDAKQSAIIRATDYIDARFLSRFRGDIAVAAQGLQFPRVSTGDTSLDGNVPVRLKRACAEYALRALSISLAPDPTIDASGRAALSTRKKVGPVETELSFASDGPASRVQLIRPYPAADMLMRPLLKQTSGVVR